MIIPNICACVCVCVCVFCTAHQTKHHKAKTHSHKNMKQCNSATKDIFTLCKREHLIYIYMEVKVKKEKLRYEKNEWNDILFSFGYLTFITAKY
jgi:hypothetical protein